MQTKVAQHLQAERHRSLFRGTQDAPVIALDAATGKQLWNIKAGDPETGLFLSASPIVWNGLVYIGTAGADWGQKARMMAYSAADGHREQYRFPFDLSRYK